MIVMWLVTGLILAAALVHIFFLPTRSARSVCAVLLQYLMPGCVGLGGVVAFCGHAFMADRVAASIGWPTGNPFQFEVAVTNLAFGILGLLCLWRRDDFWLATGIGYSVFLGGAAYGHLREMVIHENFAPNNVGAVLLADVVMPIALLAILCVYYVAKARGEGGPASPACPTGRLHTLDV